MREDDRLRGDALVRQQREHFDGGAAVFEVDHDGRVRQRVGPARRREHTALERGDRPVVDADLEHASTRRRSAVRVRAVGDWHALLDVGGQVSR